MKLLITGSNGFVGKNLIQHAKSSNIFTDILTPNSTELNLLNEQDTTDYIKTNKPDIVIHLAAKLSGIDKLSEAPLEFYESNMMINFNIVRSCLANDIKKFVALGTSCSYSSTTPLPMLESYLWTAKPENTYGTAKLCLLEHLQSQTKMEYIYLIPGNIYGPDDHFHDKENAHVIPATVRKFENAKMNNLNSIDFWGDGTQIRDFIFIDDLCDIILHFIKNDIYSGKIINISTSNGTQLKQIIMLIKKYLNMPNIDINWQLDKPIGIKEKVLGNSELLKLVDDYSFTSIEEGLKKTILWYLENNQRR